MVQVAYCKAVPAGLFKLKEEKTMSFSVPESTEIQDDRAFRKHMGEVECPFCKTLLSNDEIYQLNEDVCVCSSCGEVLE